MLCALPEEYSDALRASCAAGRKQTQSELCKIDTCQVKLTRISFAQVKLWWLGCISTHNVATIPLYWKVSFGTSQGDTEQLWPTLDLMQDAKLCTQNNANIFTANYFQASQWYYCPKMQSELISIEMKATDGLNLRIAFIPSNIHCNRST